MIERTLNSEQIDNIIASAPKRLRRIDWNRVREMRLALPQDWKTDAC
jgi:hypothetical protein